MKRIFLIIIVLIIAFLSSVSFKTANADSTKQSFSLTSLILDIKEERSTKNKFYNAYVLEKVNNNIILTDEYDNTVFATIVSGISSFIIVGEKIIFKIDDARYENEIFIVNISDANLIDNEFYYPDTKKVSINNLYGTYLKKIEIEYIYLNNGKVWVDDFLLINVYDGFTEKQYENGEHMHVVGYLTRKNDRELCFYVTSKYLETHSTTINTNTLGIKNSSYGNGTASINGIEFEYREIGDYGFDIQMRSKLNSTNNLSSEIFNIEAFKKPIKSIEINYNKSKTPRNETHTLLLSFGNTKECSDAKIYLNTSEAKTQYKLEVKKDFKYLKISVPENYKYSLFIESFVIDFKE